jgi:hypothetical protein
MLMDLSAPPPFSTAAEPSIDTTVPEFGGDTISAKLRHAFDNASALSASTRPKAKAFGAR